MKTLLITVTSMLLLGTSLALQAAEKPNIVFFHADDCGWGNLACHGREGLVTPKLDQLAKEGTDRKKDGLEDRFTKFDAKRDSKVSVEEFVTR